MDYVLFYVVTSLALLGAGLSFYLYWDRLLRGVPNGEPGHRMAHLIKGLFLRLTLAQVVIVGLAMTLWYDGALVPRGLIGWLVQSCYLLTFAWGIWKVRKL